MKPSKNTFTVMLMISGMVLLLILQTFWLQSTYQKALYDFHRETGFLFRTVVSAMQDSVMMRNIEPVEGDSALKTLNVGYSLAEGAGDSKKVDSLADFSKVHFFVRSSNDSLKDDVFKKLALRFSNIQDERVPGAHRGFILKLGPDTLNIDSLSAQYKRALAIAGIEAPFIIKHLKTTPGEVYDRLVAGPAGNPLLDHVGEEKSLVASLSGDTLQSSEIGINQMNRYAVSLVDVRGLMIKEIMPQILFSVLLTLIITMAFVLMYRSIRSQEKLMEIKNDFINNITHELKTPLTTVSVAIEALKNFRALDNPALTHEYLDIAQNELNRLTLMTDKILKTSVFEKGVMDFNPEKVNLDRTVLQILTSMKLVFEERNACVTYEKEGKEFELEGSPIHLTNVIYNLIDNSLKYSPNNPVIHILLKNSSEKLALSVRDSGIGIPSEYQKKIFEKFFRVPTGDVHNAKGYGLGLSYVAAVVKSHCGAITLESNSEEGSCFTVFLPKRLIVKSDRKT